MKKFSHLCASTSLIALVATSAVAQTLAGNEAEFVTVSATKAHAAQLTPPLLPAVHAFFAAVDTPRLSATAPRFSPSSSRAPPPNA